jgi:uridine kinase
MSAPRIRPLTALRGELLGLPRRCRTLLVAIDGPGGSGKSTIARALHRLAPDAVQVVEMDDFYRLSAERGSTDSAEIGASFDWRRLRDQVLVPLSRDESARFQRYDWPTDELAEWRSIEPGGIVIVEGVYALRSELRGFFDFTIWVECPVEERLARGVVRDGEEALARWHEEWMPEEDRYADAERPGDHAALVVGGGSRPPIDTLRRFVELRRNQPS